MYLIVFLIILNSLFIDSLHFSSVFTHGFIQLFFNVMNRIKIINQVWLGLIKFRQLIKYNKIFSFINHLENEARKVVPDLFLFLKNALYEVKASGLQFDSPPWHTIKTHCINFWIIFPEKCSILTFWGRVWE